MAGIFWQFMMVAGVAMGAFYMWAAFHGQKVGAVRKSPIVSYRDLWTDDVGQHECESVEPIDDELDKWILCSTKGHTKEVYEDEIVPLHNILTMAKQNTDSGRGMWTYRPLDPDEKKLREELLRRKTKVREDLASYVKRLSPATAKMEELTVEEEEEINKYIKEGLDATKIHTNQAKRPGIQSNAGTPQRARTKSVPTRSRHGGSKKRNGKRK